MDAITSNPNARVDAAESTLIKLREQGIKTMVAVDFPVEHFFAPGLYARSLWRPADTYIVGHAHKHAHMSILLTGRLRIWSGGVISEIVGPSRPFTTEGGLRKLTYAVEDSTLITFHPTNNTNVEELEEELVDKSVAFTEFIAGDAFRRLKIANCSEMSQEKLPA